jgi:hypothetical protein
MERQKPVAAFKPQTYPRLWLASSHGVRLPSNDEVIGAAEEPEAILEIEFEGLTESEQRAALKGFPGGRRFRLATARH